MVIFTRNYDAYITTPPFGHPFLKKKGNFPAPALLCRHQKTSRHERPDPTTKQIASIVVNSLEFKV